MTFGEACSIVLSFCLIVLSSLIFSILVKYYDSINFTQRNTVTYLSLYLINICFANVVSLVILYDSSLCQIFFIICNLESEHDDLHSVWICELSYCCDC